MERRSIGRLMAGVAMLALLGGALWLGASGVSAAQRAGRGPATGAGMMGSATPGPGMMGNAGAGMMGGGYGGMMGAGLGSDLDRGDTSAPFDQRFLDAMIPHHEMAVQSAQRMIAASSRPEMRDLAGRIITGQQREIDQMTGWRAAWYATAPAASGASPCGGGMMGAGTSGMMGRGAGMMGGADLDRMFLQMMIPHHEAAIRMAQAALAQAGRPEIKTLAQQIITTQQAEISEMRGYLQAWYGVGAP